MEAFMKIMITLFLALMTQFSFATDGNKSQMMEEVMLKAGVPSCGRRHSMQANISCKKSRKGIFSCHLFSGGEDNSFSIDYLGEDAQLISKLLISYNVTPEGRRLRQQGTFECKLQYPKIKDSMLCEQIDYDFSIN